MQPELRVGHGTWPLGRDKSSLSQVCFLFPPRLLQILSPNPGAIKTLGTLMTPTAVPLCMCDVFPELQVPLTSNSPFNISLRHLINRHLDFPTQNSLFSPMTCSSPCLPHFRKWFSPSLLRPKILKSILTFLFSYSLCNLSAILTYPESDYWHYLLPPGIILFIALFLPLSPLLFVVYVATSQLYKT